MTTGTDVDKDVAQAIQRHLARLPDDARRRLAEETVSEEEIKAIARRAVARLTGE